MTMAKLFAWPASNRVEAGHSIHTHCCRAAPRWACHSGMRWRHTAATSILFCTFWLCDPDLWPFDLIFTGGRGIVMYYLCAKFGDFSLSRFGLIARTESQRRMIAIFMRLPFKSRRRRCYRCAGTIFQQGVKVKNHLFDISEVSVFDPFQI